MAPQAPATPQPRMDTANGKFELIKDIGSGNFGVAKLMRDTRLHALRGGAVQMDFACLNSAE